MSLTDDIKTIQRAVGAKPDGVFGPQSARLTLANLSKTDQVDPQVVPPDTAELDERTAKNIATLDPKAREVFTRFALLAKATAATFGCEYKMISGNRTYAQQDELYAQGRTKAGRVVTHARGGYSNHNFAIAADFGVFQGAVYLDGGTPAQAKLAVQVHAAAAVQARALGLEWGGDWTSLKDYPHFEIATGLTLAGKRALMAAKGSVL